MVVMKKCFKCSKEKKLSEYYKHSRMEDGHLGKCKECTRKDTRENRIKRKKYYDNYDQRRYRNDILRFWKLKYSGMRRRINGLNNGSRYVGKALLSKKKFLDWCEKTKQKFMKLYRNWVKNNYQQKFSPSIDRINNNMGYVINNLQWITQRDNSSKGIREKPRPEICTVKECEEKHRALGLCNKHWTRQYKKLKK